MASARKRISQFRRKSASTICLTQRDAKILLALHTYRFLTTDHIMALTGSESRWGINKRLRLLYDHKYIDRPQAQRALFQYADKRPTIYALGNQGASLLWARFGIPMPSSVYWTEKNRRVREHYIEHTLGIAEFMVEIEMQCREDGHLRLVPQDEILAASPPQIRTARYPFRWKTRVRHRGKAHEIAIAPDYVFGIEATLDDGSKSKRFYFAEIDRGTMPINRRDIRQSSIMRKVLSYADTFERGLAKDRFGISGFQVLFVTTSQRRSADMQAAIANTDEFRVPANLMLFRDKANRQQALPFKQNWTNIQGKPADMV
ncbi:MAG: replication-relaxation family protein [Erythrobacter sp.]